MVSSVTSDLSVLGCGRVAKNSARGRKTKKPCFNCFVICLACENMADQENEQPTKKCRLSLSLKKKSKLDASERFKQVNDDEMEVAVKGVLPQNTARNNQWAVKNFVLWIKARESSDEPFPDDLLSSTNVELVCKWLCRFVLETRQESGEPYPPRSIHLLLCGLHWISRSEGAPFNFLDKADSHFRDLHNTLDTICNNLHTQGIGATKRSAAVIITEDVELLWEKQIMSFENPRQLQNCVFFYVGLHFSLRGGQEQRDLKVDQLKCFPAEIVKYDEQTYYEYVEFIAKNNQHRFKDIRGKNKSVKAFAVPGSKKCPVKILDYYLSKLPANPKAFYLRPRENVLPDDVS